MPGEQGPQQSPTIQESGARTVRPSAKEVVFGVATAAGEFAKGLTHFIPHALETREKDPAQTRKEYKLAMLRPYLDKLPIEVIEVMLDLDLIRFARDKHGRDIPFITDKHGRAISRYESKLQRGEVQEAIDKDHHIRSGKSSE